MQRSAELPTAAAAPVPSDAPADRDVLQTADLDRVLEALLARCQRLRAEQPHIVGLGQFRRRLQKELSFLRKLAAGLGSACGDAGQSCGFCSGAAGAVVGTCQPLNACAQLQGVANNAQGLGAELGVAESAPGVTAMSRRFWAAPLQRAAGTEQVPGDAPGGATAGCEVDVVAQQGHAWVEVKSHGPFGVHSTHWLGSAGHNKGLKQQAIEQLAVASAPCNQLRWAPPVVVFHFAGGASADVAAELRAMGITVTGPGPVTADQLPPLPPPPAAANADVTTLCALVSEVTNADPRRPDLCAWAARTSHWRDCLAAEQGKPLQVSLASQLASRRLVAAAPTLQHFEALVSKLGGPRERARWARLRPLITPIEVADQPLATTATASDTTASLGQVVMAHGAEDTCSELADCRQACHGVQLPAAAASLAAAAAAAAAQQAAPHPAEATSSGGAAAHQGDLQDQRGTAALWQEDWAVHLLSGSTMPPAATVYDDGSSNVAGVAAPTLGGGGAHWNSSAVNRQCSTGNLGSGAPAAPKPDSSAAQDPGSALMSPPPAVSAVDVEASRLMPVQHISAEAKTVFAVGDAAKALTLTANGRAVAAAAAGGVRLEAFVHRAVWLAGF